jgi:hypothetical protein
VDLTFSKTLSKIILKDIKSFFKEIIKKEEQGSFATCFNSIIVRNIISLKVGFFLLNISTNSIY